MQSNHYSSLFAIYMATFLAGFTGLFARTIPADALSITQMRCTVAVLCFCVFMGLTRRSLRLESRGQYVGIWGLGLLMGAHWASYFHGMQVSSIAIGMLAFFSYPVITVFLEPLFARTKISLVDIVAAALVLIGVFLLVVDDSEGLGQLRMSSYLQGALWGVLSALFMALRNLFQKYQYPTVPSSSSMFHQALAIAVVFVLFLDVDAVREFTAKDILLIVMLGFFVTTLGHTLFVVALKGLPAKSVAMINCGQPVIGIILGWLVLGEEPSWQVYVGGTIILSVALFESWQQARKAKSKRAA